MLAFNLTDVHQLTEASWFCSQPWGDGPTRTQTMDCLLAGENAPPHVAAFRLHAGTYKITLA